MSAAQHHAGALVRENSISVVKNAQLSSNQQDPQWQFQVSGKKRSTKEQEDDNGRGHVWWSDL